MIIYQFLSKKKKIHTFLSLNNNFQESTSFSKKKRPMEKIFNFLLQKKCFDFQMLIKLKTIDPM